MATPIISIPIDDTAFKNFMALYTQYETSLKALPGAWQNVNQAAGANGITLNELAAALLTQNELLRETVSGHKDVAKAASQVDGVIGSIGKKVETATKNAAKMTLELVKWGALAGAAFGGIGGLGLFGIDKLAASASQISRGARGLGVDPAAQQAFGVNYGRYVSPDAMLSNMNEMQADQSKWGAFLAAGISTQEVQQDDPEQLARRAVQAAKTLWDQAGPNNHTAQFMQAHGLDALLPGGLQDWKRIGNASQSDLDQSSRDAQQDRQAFALDPRALKAWTEFTNQMHRAGTTMEDVLIGKLSPLAGPLTDLSKAVTTAIGTLLADPDLGDWIKALGHGIEEFATYLASPAFKADLATAEDDFHKFSVAMGELLGWTERTLVRLGIISDPNGGTTGAPSDSSPSPHGNGPDSDPQSLTFKPFANNNLQSDGQPSSAFTRWMYPRGFPGRGITSPTLDYNGNPVVEFPGSRTNAHPANSAELQKNAQESWDFWKSKGYTDPAAAAEIGNEWGESGGDPNARGDGGAAGGIEQWHKDRRDKILAATGIDVWNASHSDQLKAAWLERQGIDPQSTASRDAIKFANSVRQGVTGLVTGVERSANQAADIQKRAGLGQAALDRFGGHDSSRQQVDEALRANGLTKAPVAKEDASPVPGGSSGKQLVQALQKLSQRATSGGSKVTIDNRTGGDAVVSSAQLGYG